MSSIPQPSLALQANWNSIFSTGNDNIFTYLLTLSQEERNRLFSNEFSCRAIFQSLTTLAQQYVLRLLFVSALPDQKKQQDAAAGFSVQTTLSSVSLNTMEHHFAMLILLRLGFDFLTKIILFISLIHLFY